MLYQKSSTDRRISNAAKKAFESLRFNGNVPAVEISPRNASVLTCVHPQVVWLPVRRSPLGSYRRQTVDHALVSVATTMISRTILTDGPN